MHISSYSDDKAQVDINKLINNGKVQQYSGRIGCCMKTYLIFKDDNHNHYYNPNKLVSDTLRKQVFNHLYKNSTPYTNMSKRLNKKTTINDNKLAVSDKNEYVRKLIEQLRKINKGELDETK